MADSDIVVSNLAATATLRGVKLSWDVVDPHANGLLNLSLDQVEVWASTTNNRNTASLVVEGLIDATYAGAVEEQTYYFWIRPRSRYQDSSGVRYYGEWHPLSATAGVSAVAIGMSGLMFGLTNARLVATVNANALTFAVKTIAGNDPSASDPVYVAFRNADLATGGYTIRAITAALSLTIPSGTSFFFTSVLFRLWWTIFDDGGTLRLAVGYFSLATTYPLPESGIRSALAMSSIAGGTAAVATLYAEQAISSKAFRIIGYTEWTSGMTSGAWSSAPQIVQMFGLGVKKPGDLVGYFSNTFNGYAAPSVQNIPLDNTAPLNSEGASVLALTVTPSSGANTYKVTSILNVSRATAGPMIHTLFRDDISTPQRVSTLSLNADELGTSMMSSVNLFNTASALVFTQRYGGTGGVNVAYNGLAGGQLFNGYIFNELVLEEYMG